MPWEPFGRVGRERRAADPVAEDPLARLLAANRRAARPDARVAARRTPRRRLVIVTCMDARIDPLRIFGLALGDAAVVRNAGAVVGEDVLRSVGLAASALGVAGAVVLGHSDCAAHGGDHIAREVCVQGARRLRSAGAVAGELGVLAALYDVRSGRVDALESL